jgi:hypothetical protein
MSQLRRVALVAVICAGCEGGVSSEEGARRAYLGLHEMVDLAINLGMSGYNEASSANIPAQEGAGETAGTITVTGQVDQGASDNKEMRLYVELIDYEDMVEDIEDEEAEPLMIAYDTRADGLPYLQLSLRDIPNGTFTGTFTGIFDMTGDLEGDVELNLSMAGEIEEAATAEQIQRVPGTTQITGTASSGYGVYTVDLTI